VSNQGFQLKPIQHLGFGSETICPSRGISDLAVKLFAQAEELEKPFRVFICRHWHCDSRSCGRNFICRLGERSRDSLRRVACWDEFNHCWA
jgi:hypothetical protein